MFGDIGGITDTIARGIANLLAVLERIAVALERIANQYTPVGTDPEPGRPHDKGW